MEETTAASALSADPPVRPRDKWDKMLARMEERMEETRTLILAAAAAKEAECEGLRKELRVQKEEVQRLCFEVLLSGSSMIDPDRHICAEAASAVAKLITSFLLR